MERRRRRGRASGVHSVLRALTLLDVLAQEGREMGVVDLGRRVSAGLGYQVGIESSDLLSHRKAGRR